MCERRAARSVGLALAGGLLVAGCETQDCPGPGFGGAFVRLEYFEASIDTACTVTAIGEDAPPYVQVSLMCDGESMKSLVLYTRPAVAPPFTVGQAIRVRASENYGASHVRERFEVDDAATSRPLLRSIDDHDYDNHSSTDFEDLDLAPFSFGNELACRPVPGTRGDVRLAFDVTLEDETLRMFDGSSAKIGDYMLWISAGMDGHKHIVYFYAP